MRGLGGELEMREGERGGYSIGDTRRFVPR